MKQNFLKSIIMMVALFGVMNTSAQSVVNGSEMSQVSKQKPAVLRILRPQASQANSLDKSHFVVSQKSYNKRNQQELNDSLLAAQSSEATAKWLRKGADPNARSFTTGATPIMRAKTAEQTKLLLEAGANPNAQECDGYTAIHWAVTAEQTRLLLEAGADPNVKARVVGMAGKPSVYVTPLMFVHDAEQVKLLIEAGADVNFRNSDGDCPLLRAESAEVTALMLQAGAKPNVSDDAGFTPLILAQTAEQTRLLLEAGADPNAITNTGVCFDDNWNSSGMGITALFCAKTTEQTRLLLNAGTNPNIISESGLKAIDWVKLPEQKKLLAEAMAKQKK